MYCSKIITVSLRSHSPAESVALGPVLSLVRLLFVTYCWLGLLSGRPGMVFVWLVAKRQVALPQTPKPSHGLGLTSLTGADNEGVKKTRDVVSAEHTHTQDRLMPTEQTFKSSQKVHATFRAHIMI